MLQRILWFDARMTDDTFNWDLPAQEYTKVDNIGLMAQYPSEEITFEEALQRLVDCSNKYDIKQVQTYPIEQQKRINKMFKIINSSGSQLSREIQIIEKNKLDLQNQGYISLKDADALSRYINWAISFMGKDEKNKGLTITFLISAMQTLINECGYNEPFKISNFGSYPLEDI